MNLDTAVPAFGAPRTGRLNPMIVLRLAAIAAGLCLVFSPAFAAEQLRLKSEVTVNADVLTLGDLAEGVSGPAAETPVFRAPAPGETGTIQAARITEVASRFGLAFEPGRRLRQIVVTRGSRRVAAAEIEAAVKRAIELQHGVDARGLSIVLDTGSPALRLAPDSTAPITADAISFDRRSRRFSALVSAGGDPSSSVRLSGTAAELVDVALLNRSLNRGETVIRTCRSSGVQGRRYRAMSSSRPPRSRGASQGAASRPDRCCGPAISASRTWFRAARL
jgi:flagella basal body P-ring formation protein FlgA